ncbi:MAG: spore germination protein [Eubacteriales bacterium]|nr:spore germination protein [Clostridiales bacterium]
MDNLNSFEHKIAEIDRALRIGSSFDVIKKEFTLGCGARAVFYYIDGFVNQASLSNLMVHLLGDRPDAADCIYNIPFADVEHEREPEKLALAVLSGATVFIADGVDDAAIIDSRGYPMRSIEEPDHDKVLRGAREGFTESLLQNTALIRRHIRDPRLTIKLMKVGRITATDVALCYIEGAAEPEFVQSLERQISEIDIDALTMAHETLAEQLAPRKWYNPFPKVRYTERPDASAAMLEEGSVIVMCDTSPSAMILPTAFFDFLQETGDYYFPILVGSYMRLVRLFVSILTVFLIPTWYMLVRLPHLVPKWMDFIIIDEPAALPVFVQLILAELVVDGLKLASLNTPSTLAGSFSAISGLLLGNYAIDTGYFTDEVVLYIAFVSIANFTQSSYELGYALKLCRIMILCLTAAFSIWGYIAGLIIMLVLIATTNGISGPRGYLYPLIPFNGRALARLFVRTSKPRPGTR